MSLASGKTALSVQHHRVLVGHQRRVDAPQTLMGLAQIAEQSGLNVFSCRRKLQPLGQHLPGPCILAIAKQRNSRIEPDRWRRSPRRSLQIARSRSAATSLVEMIFARSKMRLRRSRVFARLREIDPRRLQYHQPMRAFVKDERLFLGGFAGSKQR